MKKLTFLSIVSIFATLSWGIHAQENTNNIIGNEKGLSENNLDASAGIPNGNGALPPSPEQLEDIRKNFVERDFVPPTKIGLERMNEARAKKGLPILNMKEATEEAMEKGRVRKEKLEKELNGKSGDGTTHEENKK